MYHTSQQAKKSANNHLYMHGRVQALYLLHPPSTRTTGVPCAPWITIAAAWWMFQISGRRSTKHTVLANRVFLRWTLDLSAKWASNQQCIDSSWEKLMVTLHRKCEWQVHKGRDWNYRSSRKNKRDCGNRWRWKNSTNRVDQRYPC